MKDRSSDGASGSPCPRMNFPGSSASRRARTTDASVGQSPACASRWARNPGRSSDPMLVADRVGNCSPGRVGTLADQGKNLNGRRARLGGECCSIRGAVSQYRSNSGNGVSAILVAFFPSGKYWTSRAGRCLFLCCGAWATAYNLSVGPARRRRAPLQPAIRLSVSILPCSSYRVWISACVRTGTPGLSARGWD